MHGVLYRHPTGNPFPGLIFLTKLEGPKEIMSFIPWETHSNPQRWQGVGWIGRGLISDNRTWDRGHSWYLAPGFTVHRFRFTGLRPTDDLIRFHSRVLGMGKSRAAETRDRLITSTLPILKPISAASIPAC